MNDKDTYIPSKEDMHKLIKAFASVHVENQKDDIGPNKPDAPFFERVACMDSIDEEDYIEMAERFYKYINTQLPLIQHIAGYPPETNWADALQKLHTVGEAARKARLLREELELIARQEADERRFAVVSKLRFALKRAVKSSTGLKVKDVTSKSLLSNMLDIRDLMLSAEDDGLNITDEEIDGYLKNHLLMLVRREELHKENHTIHCERFERVWYGKNDTQFRFPNKVASIQISVPAGFDDKVLYPTLKDGIGWPNFAYEGRPLYRMSISDDSACISQVITLLESKGYVVDMLRDMLVDAPTKEVVVESTQFTARLYKDSVSIYIPYAETDLRSCAKRHGAKWQPNEKEWAVPMLHINAFVEDIDDKKELKDMILAIPEVGNYVQHKAERIAISAAPTLGEGERVEEMRKRLANVFPEGYQLYPFQYVGVRFAELSGGRCLFGDDMGIGKTIQAIAYMGLHPENMPALVVCPSNVKYNWLKECKAWLSSTYTCGVIDKGKSPVPDTDIVIINYDLMAKQKDALALRNFNTFIFDESHYLKNAKAKRTIACMELAKPAHTVLCLSGTAIPNRPIEFWNTISMLRPTEWRGRWKDYARKYCDGHITDRGFWDTTGASNQEELNALARDFMIRRLKKEVMAELPTKIRQYPIVVPSDREMKWYRDRTQMWAAGLDAPSRSEGYVLNMLNDLRKMCGEMKALPAAQWCVDYIEQAEESKPLIIFAHHIDVQESIEKHLKSSLPTLRISKINGGVNAKARQDIVDEFQDGKCDVLLATTVAAKEGLTLTAADTVVFVEREWVPGWEEQAEDRVNRIGQDADTVWAVYLTVDGTIDEKFSTIIEDKRANIKAILDGGEVGERTNISVQLLQAMVDGGELPANTMSKLTMKDVGDKTMKPKDYTKGDEQE
tara:strand:- start:426 stop:3134 length:2709 start_codon:yes stop_codon:yes gene_type:complete